LKYFDRIYKKLDTHFDSHIFESEVSDEAVKIVKKHTPSVFEESEGAVVFKGEKYGLHTRVFLNSQGLPTYEAKELANTFEKIKRYNPDMSIVTSANEITDYFKVIKYVLGLIDPKSGESLEFISHGMLRLTEGKMSSRKGNVVTGESLILDTEKEVLEKMSEREITPEEKQEIATKVAIGAIKYAILKQSPGKDIIFDRQKALSFEGDSGPYLLYTLVRAKAVLKKAEDLNIKKEVKESKCFGIEKELLKFDDVAKRAFEEKAPQKVVEYLTKLSASFNSFYAKEKIADSDDVYSPYKVMIVESVIATLQKGLWLLGIGEVERM
jgi:arginyl-tRNA synthetase